VHQLELAAARRLREVLSGLGCGSAAASTQGGKTARLERVSAVSPIHRALGEALREARCERGLSQEALALMAELHRAYYGAVERGERNPTLANILEIARALGMPTSEVLARAEALAQAGA
jgi:DNA-binding XRE family transcriptional regulator